MGGMTQAVQSGWAKLKIEASAAEKQARIDSGQDVIVGVNKYKLGEEDADRHARHRQPRGARQPGRAAARRCAPSATSAAVQAALAALTACAESGDGNLLDLSIKAVRLRATVGEVSDALEAAWGRHRADTQKVLGRLRRRLRQRRGLGAAEGRDRRVRRRRGPAAARHDRQARPGRPRPRRQGRRHARSPTSASTSTSARCSRPPRNARARRSRTTSTRSASRRSPPATRRWCRR